MKEYTIIRLSCIEEDTGFKYRRFGNKEPEQKKISEYNGGSDKATRGLSQHII